MHWTKGNLDLALADYARALKIDPQYGPAYCNRALIYAQRQNYKAAIAEGEKFIKYNPKHSDVPKINALISQWRNQMKE
jgi:tetratricopeptide (TPR) repeat protein